MFRRKWASRETEQLHTHYSHQGADWLAERLGRSPDSVTSRARLFHLPSTRCRWRQAFRRAMQSPTVNARFFEQLSPQVAYVLGAIWGWGRLKTRNRRVLKLIAPANRRDILERTLAIINSRHQIQESGERLIVEVGNSFLVDTLVAKFGSPPSRCNRNPPPRTCPSS